MDKIEQLEQRITELEQKLAAKEESETWKALAEATIVWPDENIRTDFEQKYSFEEGSEYERFDLKRAIENAPNKSPQKLTYWARFQQDLKQELGENYGLGAWDELCFLVEEAIKIYKDAIVRYILRDGKYVDMGGPREQTELKKKGYSIYKGLKRENSDKYFHQNGRHKGGPKWDKVEPVLREKLDKPYGSIRAIQDYIRKQERQDSLTPAFS